MELMMAHRKKLFKTAPHMHGSDKAARFPHLKPLSVYSRKVYCSAMSSCSVNSSGSPNSSPWNLKVELINSRASVGRKRRLDDSCLDETYDTPPKKPCLANRPSPNSSCVLTVDSFNDHRQVKLVSNQSSAVGHDEIKRIEKTLSCQKSLGFDWNIGSEMTAGQSSTSLTNICLSSPVLVPNEDSADVIAFDFDVDEIMCLSPIDSGDISADGLEDFIQPCQTYEEQLPPEEGHRSCYNSKRKQGTFEFPSNRDVPCASDEGYVTKSYPAGPGESTVVTESSITKSDEMQFIKSLKITVSNLSNTSPLVSTPLEKYGVVKRLKNDLDEESHSSPTINCKRVKASSAISLNLDSVKTEEVPTFLFLNKNSEEGNIVHEGTAICKSLDHKQTAIRVKEEKEVFSACQQHADSENKLPLDVQVKTEVVMPDNQPSGAVKTIVQQPEKKAVSEVQRNAFKDIPRPLVLYSEEDWEKEKKVYVDSVMRHMADNVEHGVMTELLRLMNDVANQGRGGNGRRWQPPSDLTRRNYRLRNDSRLLSLDEWKNLNYGNHRRFFHVPLVFKRSEIL